MLSAQQQSQGINPMLLQMAQFQGMNPLVAMNLHPPLIPPGILAAQAGNVNNHNGIPGGLPIKHPNENENQAQQQQLQLMMKLGIDPKILAQSGLDPKFLFNMSQQAQQGPKLPDPNLLALLTGQANQPQPPQMPENMVDPKILFQMMQMGLPGSGQGPDPKLLLQLAQLGKGPDGSGLPGLPGFEQRPGQPGMPGGLAPKPVFPQPEQTKRARTRITDDQLKVLRSNFDINNSPTEEQTVNMAAQTGLPPKVIKHWFRNTLFKERQKNKDSPYNFNNPPSTMLNLEEYERTGESKVIQLNDEEKKQYSNDQAANVANFNAGAIAGGPSGSGAPETEKKESRASSPEREMNTKQFSGLPLPPGIPSSPASASELRVKSLDEIIAASTSAQVPANTISSPVNNTQAIISSCSETSIAPSLTLSSILSSQMGQFSKGGVPGNPFLPHPSALLPNFPPVSSNSLNSMGGRLPDFLNPLANMMANEQPQR